MKWGSNMDEFIKLLDKSLEYVDHYILDDTIYIKVTSIRRNTLCPYCGTSTDKVHSHYERRFQDLPIQGKKVMIILNNRKMFCNNKGCDHKTFAETFDFLAFKSKKTIRLEDEIINISQNVSSVAAARIINTGIANVGKSTICNLLKKNNHQY